MKDESTSTTAKASPRSPASTAQPSRDDIMTSIASAADSLERSQDLPLIETQPGPSARIVVTTATTDPSAAPEPSPTVARLKSGLKAKNPALGGSFISVSEGADPLESRNPTLVPQGTPTGHHHVRIALPESEQIDDDDDSLEDEASETPRYPPRRHKKKTHKRQPSAGLPMKVTYNDIGVVSSSPPAKQKARAGYLPPDERSALATIIQHGLGGKSKQREVEMEEILVPDEEKAEWVEAGTATSATPPEGVREGDEGQPSTIRIDPADMSVPTLNQSVPFLIKLAITFHKYGAPAHRVEYNIWEVAQSLGINAQFIVVPTFIMINFGDPSATDSMTRTIRCDQSLVQCEKLYLIDRLIDRISTHKILFEEAVIELDRIIEMQGRYGWQLKVGAVGFSAAGCAPLFYGGGWFEMVISLILGLAVGLCELIAGRFPNFGRVSEVFQALIVGFVTVLLNKQACFNATVLASLVWLFPGITLTLAMRELATRNIIAGTARMFAAFMTCLKLGFGLAIGAALPVWVEVEFQHTCVPPFGVLSGWYNIIFFVVVVLSFNILLDAHMHQWPGMILVSAIAYLASTVLDMFLVGEQKEIIPVLSSFVVSMTGNLYARFSDFPGIIIIFSGFLFLVPGSVGVKGAIAMLISSDIVSGLQFSFQMIIIGFSLTIGSFIANLVIMPRQSMLHKLF